MVNIIKGICSVDGGLSGGSSVNRPGSEDPHRREQKFLGIFPLLVVTAVIQNHRRGCRRASNFCMGP